MASKVAPKITLYTSHTCPWAHRSQIALRELNLDFETVIVDLSKPRTPEYLRINPRGLVPALDYNGNVLTESAIVSQFLVDAHPSHLEKASTDEGGPLQRAKINFFVDTFSSKIFGLFMGAARAATGAEKDAATTTFVEGIVKEIEPLLADANPFFGGASKLTLVEVQTGSFLLRIDAFSRHEDLLPKTLRATFESKAPNFLKWSDAVIKEKSVNYIWNEEAVVQGTLKRLGKL